MFFVWLLCLFNFNATATKIAHKMRLTKFIIDNLLSIKIFIHAVDVLFFFTFVRLKNNLA